MNKLQTLLTIAAAFLMADFTQAQSCRSGYGQQQAPGYARNYDANVGYSSYRAPTGYTTTQSSFGDVCRDCGQARGHLNRDQYNTTNYRDYRAGQYDAVCRDCNDPRCRCDAPGTGYRRDDYRRGTNYRPRTDFDQRSPRPDYDRFDRYDDRTGDLGARDFRARDFGNRDLRNREPGTRGVRTRDFGERDFRPRNDNPDLRYPTNRDVGTQYNYTSTRTPSVVQWQSDLRQAADFAKAQRRPMVVTIGADWCTHCKRMKAESFRNTLFTQSANQGGFVPVMLDADQNQSVVSRLGIRSLPTTLIVAPNMQIVERLEGFQTAEQLTQVLSRHARSAKKDSKIQLAAK